MLYPIKLRVHLASKPVQKYNFFSRDVLKGGELLLTVYFLPLKHEITNIHKSFFDILITFGVSSPPLAA
jgi:hypothetical protein